MSKRYEVDDRVGCVAVIDTTIDAPSSGLHSDDEHVVCYWEKPQVGTQCAHCGAVRLEYELSAHVDEAETMADQLNQENEQ